ncbi:MAG: HEAT repeat domain-containing protein [Lentisphaerae bacterium]|nr:HEAT repeat domain-containing protein [Lentisphaerota bacterium]
MESLDGITGMDGRTAKRGVWLWVVGVVLLLCGVARLGRLGAACFPSAGKMFSPSHTAYVLGMRIMSGWPAHVIVSVLSFAGLFAGFQLLRLRRSGWLVAVLVMIYDSVTSLLFVLTDQVIKQMQSAVETTARDSDILYMILLKEKSSQIAQVNRVMEFAFVCQFATLLILVSEWRRFFGRPVRAPRFKRKALIVASCLIVIAGMGTWTFWGAQYVTGLRFMRRVRSSPPSITAHELRQLPLSKRREVVAILVRRLATERSVALVKIVTNASISLDLSHLKAEDVPAVIAAAESSDSGVRSACYVLLGLIGTTEAEACLRQAAGREVGEEWENAIRALGKMQYAKAPPSLVARAQQADEQQAWWVQRLREFRDPLVAKSLREAAVHSDAEVRLEAVAGLRAYPGEESERVLLRALDDKDLAVRGAACSSLEMIGTATSISRLIDTLKGKDDVYRWPDMDFDCSLHDEAQATLAMITGMDFGGDPEKWRNWWERQGAKLDLEEGLARRLFTPIPPMPPNPGGSLEQQKKYMESAAFQSFHKATTLQSNTIRAISSRNMRGLAPDLARYLQLPEKKAAYQFVAARALAEWKYQEGIEWLIDWVGNDLHDGNRMFAIKDLARACGVNFFSDKKRWLEWWAANRARFLQALDGRD